MFLHILSTAGRFALFELIRMLTGRFREVGLSKNWVNCVWFGSLCLWPTRLADEVLDPLHQMMNLVLLYLGMLIVLNLYFEI